MGWMVAQGWKTLTGVVKARKAGQAVNWLSFLARSGGMPSGHTASLTAMVVCLGQILGYEAPSFVLGVGLTMIVVYDAVNVRYAVGRQGEALNGLLEGAKKPILPVVAGHTVPQVIVGVIIGVIIGLLVGMLAGSHAFFA